MAKIEKDSNKPTKKTKAKKRKHETNEEEEEEVVPTKSVIISKEPENLPPKKRLSKKLKRKPVAEDDDEPDSAKKSKPNSPPSDEDEEMQDPTAEELLESEKPENVKSILTVRQKKKLKHQQRLETQKDHGSKKEVTRNEEYLQKWKNNQGDWKFEKLRQISIQQSVFDDTKISAEYWPIALEYLSGSKGAAKNKITKAAEALIDELDKQAEQAIDGDSTLITSSEKYRRARELLQSFD